MHFENYIFFYAINSCSFHTIIPVTTEITKIEMPLLVIVPEEFTIGSYTYSVIDVGLDWITRRVDEFIGDDDLIEFIGDDDTIEFIVFVMVDSNTVVRIIEFDAIDVGIEVDELVTDAIVEGFMTIVVDEAITKLLVDSVELTKVFRSCRFKRACDCIDL